MAGAKLAVIDLGSNSGRVVVVRADAQGVIDVLADERAPLRLIQHLDARGNLSPHAVEHVLTVLRDFHRVAAAAGARTTLAVATAAVREANNGPDLLRRIRRELGLKVRILDAESEARCAFLGAVYGLPVRSGLVLDIGGGSLQVSRFSDRRLQRSWSLPLGALRIHTRFLKGDPPTRGQIRQLRTHVHAAIARAGIPSLRRAEVLVGTGGTVRNLAKVDSRRRSYPIPRLHGYELTRARLQELTLLLGYCSQEERAFLPGMNAERADSIPAGSIIAETLMDHVGARRLLVAGQGLREGVVLETRRILVPPVKAVRARSVAGLASRFASWEKTRAARRLTLTRELHRRLDSGPPGLMAELLEHAAIILDIGRSVDYYRRHEHAAAIVRATGLLGFGHREILLLSILIEMADKSEWNLKRYRPLLREEDRGPLERASLVLALADLIEHRLPPKHAARVSCSIRKESIVLRVPALAAWNSRELESRFRRAFGRELICERPKGVSSHHAQTRRS